MVICTAPARCVLYRNNGGASIGGLETEGIYYVIVVDDHHSVGCHQQDALNGIALLSRLAAARS
jgi:hypothetical protein